MGGDRGRHACADGREPRLSKGPRRYAGVLSAPAACRLRDGCTASGRRVVSRCLSRVDAVGSALRTRRKRNDADTGGRRAGYDARGGSGVSLLRARRRTAGAGVCGDYATGCEIRRREIRTGDAVFDLKGKVALITGGASGIGAATARRLTAAGASVIVADLNEAAAKTLAGELPGARGVAMDVTSAASITAAMEELNQLDILVNNAGIGLVGGIAQTEAADFDRL